MNTKTPIEDAGAAQAAHLIQQTLRDVPRQSTSPVPPAHTVASIPQSQPIDELEALRLQVAGLKTAYAALAKLVADNYLEYGVHTKQIIPVVNTLNSHAVETRDLLDALLFRFLHRSHFPVLGDLRRMLFSFRYFDAGQNAFPLGRPQRQAGPNISDKRHHFCSPEN